MSEVTALGSVGPGIPFFPFLSHGPVAASAVSLSLQESRQVKSQKWLLSGPVRRVLSAWTGRTPGSVECMPSLLGPV